MRWKRYQKYLPRPRHLYALFFNSGCCYVGRSLISCSGRSSTDTYAEGWQGRSFQFVPLGPGGGHPSRCRGSRIRLALQSLPERLAHLCQAAGRAHPRSPPADDMADEKPGPWFAWPVTAPAPRRHAATRSGLLWGAVKWLLFYPGLLVAGPLILRLTLGYC